MSVLFENFAASEPFWTSLFVIVSSEIGDKTFFIAAIMSMKFSRAIVFSGAAAALVLMTCVSAVVGAVLPTLLSKRVTHYVSISLFIFFGVRLLYDAFSSSHPEDSGELAEVERTLEDVYHSKDGNRRRNSPKDSRTKFGEVAKSTVMHSYLSSVIIQVFTMTFFAEWGDRSQISTIAMAASKDVWAVATGASLGHCLCTGLAVIGGKMLASRIDEEVVAYCGGFLLLVFAIAGLITGH